MSQYPPDHAAALRPHPRRVSVVVPLYNEESSLGELIRRTTAMLDGLPDGPHEMVLVDDGSRDRTADLLAAAAARDPRIVVVSLARNFGHQPALSAGLDHAGGDVVVVMDGDLQDDPDVIPAFIKLYRQGYDVVYAERVNRKEPLWLKACYAIFYRLLARISDTTLPLDAGDFGLMSRRVLREMQRLPERNRYLRGLRAWVGFRQIGLPVERTTRHSGRSKYSIWRLMRLAMDGIFAFSTAPIRAATSAGALIFATASLYGVWALYAKFFLDRSPQGFTGLALLIILLGGANLFFLGVVGEYVGRVYEEVKERPVYIVADVLRSEIAPPSGSDAVPAARSLTAAEARIVGEALNSDTRRSDRG